MRDPDTLEGRWMSLDVGSKRIGVGLSDRLRITARPLATLRRTGLEEDARRVLELAVSHEVTLLVVGLPLHMDGTPAASRELADPLVLRVSEISNLPVVWCDERLSSKEAEERMAEARIPVSRRRQRRDEFAAAIILQRYMEGAK